MTSSFVPDQESELGTEVVPPELVGLSGAPEVMGLSRWGVRENVDVVCMDVAAEVVLSKLRSRSRFTRVFTTEVLGPSVPEMAAGAETRVCRTEVLGPSTPEVELVIRG